MLFDLLLVGVFLFCCWLVVVGLLWLICCNRLVHMFVCTAAVQDVVCRSRLLFVPACLALVAAICLARGACRCAAVAFLARPLLKIFFESISDCIRWIARACSDAFVRVLLARLPLFWFCVTSAHVYLFYFEVCCVFWFLVCSVRVCMLLFALALFPFRFCVRCCFCCCVCFCVCCSFVFSTLVLALLSFFVGCACLCVCLFVCLFVCSFVCLFVCLFVKLLLSRFVCLLVLFSVSVFFASACVLGDPTPRILSIGATWPQISPEWASGPHFEHLGCLAPDIARMGLRGLILSIWAGWPQKWPEWGSEAAL